MSELVRRTLSKRLSRTIMILAVPLFILSLGYFYQHARTLLHKEAVQRSKTILRTTEQLVENYLSSIETAARSNVWLMEENFNPDSLSSLSRRIVKLNGSVLSCSVATEPDAFDGQNSFSVYSIHDGDTVITANEPEYEYFHKNWYKKPVQMGHACWINPFSDFTEGVINHHDAVGSYCIPLRPNGNNIIKGVVSVDFSFETLRQTVFATHHPYPSSYYMLLGPAGGYLIHPESKLLFKKTIFTATDSVEHPDIIALGRAMTGGKYGAMHVTFNNVLCHVSYMPLSNNSGWSIALVCHDDDVLADYNQLSVILIVFVLIGMLVIAWLTRKVVLRNIRPLHELMKATEQVSKGNYDTEIALTKNKDVIGKLQNAFHDMQLALISHRKNIKKNEEEIAEESAELERTLPLAQEASRNKDQFVKGVWRQITTPLNSIESLAHVLQGNIALGLNRKQRPGEDIQQISNTMKHQATVLHRNTLMLFDISDARIADTKRYEGKEDVVCSELSRECISYIEGYFPGLAIHFETELPDSFSVKTNRLFLTLTMREVLYNAAKYSDREHITLRLTQDDTSVHFIVEDVGPGLPVNSKDWIFVPFRKTNDLSEGFGIGLPLCKLHMEGMGGNIVLDESYRQGCRFIIEVPK